MKFRLARRIDGVGTLYRDWRVNGLRNVGGGDSRRQSGIAEQQIQWVERQSGGTPRLVTIELTSLFTACFTMLFTAESVKNNVKYVVKNGVKNGVRVRE